MNKLNVLPPNPEEEPLGRFPSWLHRNIPSGNEIFRTNSILRKHNLNTVCEEAKCPNRLECYTKKTATFLALGKECTRNCAFCDIDFSKQPKAPEADEPLRIAHSVKDLGLRHVVITMVARDDLPLQGAPELVAIVRAVRHLNPGVTIELLTSDFGGHFEALDLVLNERPEVFNHNLETVRSLTPRIRHKATFERSLAVLAHAKRSQAPTYVKTGLMLGLGETSLEVEETLRELAALPIDIVTLGQYLQASSKKIRVKEFIPPSQFEAYATFGQALGIPHVYSGPFVRSSYNAALFAPPISGFTTKTSSN